MFINTVYLTYLKCKDYMDVFYLIYSKVKIKALCMRYVKYTNNAVNRRETA